MTKAPEELKEEYQTFEQVNIGDIIIAPTPGLEKNKLYVYRGSADSTSSTKTNHKQIVIEKHNWATPKMPQSLETLMITTCGQIRLKDETIWTRYESRLKERNAKFVRKDVWGAYLRYLVPLEPNEPDAEGVKTYGQPNYVVRYQEGFEHESPNRHWVDIFNRFRVKPIPHGEHAGKYKVYSNIRVDPDSLQKLIKLFLEAKSERELGGNATVQSSSATQSPETSINNPVPSQTPNNKGGESRTASKVHSSSTSEADTGSYAKAVTRTTSGSSQAKPKQMMVFRRKGAGEK